MKDEEKYWYDVALCAEGISEGCIQLTEEEAKIVDYATSPSNWHDAKLEKYSGRFHINLSSKRKNK